MTDLSTPGLVMRRLEDISAEAAIAQNEWERVAREWFRAKRDRELEQAKALIAADGTVDVRKAQAALAVAGIGVEEEASYEALKGVCRLLDTRAAIGMALLKAQGRS